MVGEKTKKGLGCNGIRAKSEHKYAQQLSSPAPHSLGLWQRVQGRIRAVPGAQSRALPGDVRPSAAAAEV